MNTSFVKAKDAPKGRIHFSVANSDFDLDDKGSIDVEDNPVLAADLAASPFLQVQDAKEAAQAPEVTQAPAASADSNTGGSK
jgi:hypothetical protein